MLLPSSDPRALPADFTTWPDARKLQWILSATLDQAATVCTWRLETLDMGRLAIWDRVRHATWAIMLRMTERRLDAEAERAIVEAMAATAAKSKTGAPADEVSSPDAKRH